MRARKDIDPQNTWVVSDTHFGHDNIVGFCHRPQDHEQVMIAEWRKVVPDGATVVHLGDLCYRGNARFKHLMAPELTGERKLLVEGNHDRQRRSFYRACGFQIVHPFQINYQKPSQKCRFCIDGFKQSPLSLAPTKCPVCGGSGDEPTETIAVSFSHYAWEKSGKPQPTNHWRLHGHIHNNGYTRNGYVPFLKNHINLSVEQTKYRPVNLKSLLDAAVWGIYSETTEHQLAEVRERKAANLEAKGA